MTASIKLSLTPIEAALIWNLVDAQLDAGACSEGNTPLEYENLHSVRSKLLRISPKFKEGRTAFLEERRP